MTLQLRRKRPITLRTINLETAPNSKVAILGTSLSTSLAMALVLAFATTSPAQQWQPTRVANRQVRHITDAPATATQQSEHRTSQAGQVRMAGHNSSAQTQVSSAVRWQPDRVHREAYEPEFTAPPSSNAAPQFQSAAGQAAQRQDDVFSGTGQKAGGTQAVVLRWISTEPEPPIQTSSPTTSPISSQAVHSQPRTQQALMDAAQEPSLRPTGPAFADIQPVANELRGNQSYVSQATYQQDGGLQFDDLPDLPPLGNQGNGMTEPALPDVTQPFGPESTMPELGDGNLPDLPAQDAPPVAPSTGGEDALDQPEEAPAPQEARPANPFLQPPGNESPSDGAAADSPETTPELDALPEPKQDQGSYDPDLQLPDRSANSANTPSCSELRERIRQRPISNVVLNTAPIFGEGLRSVGEDNEAARRDFAATSPVREWRDVTNRVIAQGRMIDLCNEQVILEVGGSEIALDLIKLSDTDVKYVGSAWNIPATCGVGNVPFEGREFVASTVQFTAPGNCHKPLYFQQAQLERYGHSAGPVVQPLLSTAHFFGNIAVLPYKMGIHPPSECQYSLGYIRPGNCAPYMLEPIPLSLRGALAQAGFATGLSGLIP